MSTQFCGTPCFCFLSLSNRCIIICPLQCILWFRYILALSDQSKHSASSLSQLCGLHSSSDCCVGPVICMPGVRSVSPIRHSFSYIPLKVAQRDSRAVYLRKVLSLWRRPVKGDVMGLISGSVSVNWQGGVGQTKALGTNRA